MGCFCNYSLYKPRNGSPFLGRTEQFKVFTYSSVTHPLKKTHALIFISIYFVETTRGGINGIHASVSLCVTKQESFGQVRHFCIWLELTLPTHPSKNKDVGRRNGWEMDKPVDMDHWWLSSSWYDISTRASSFLSLPILMLFQALISIVTCYIYSWPQILQASLVTKQIITS